MTAKGDHQRRRLRTARKERGWTLGHLAAQIGVTRQHLSLVELGKSGTSPRLRRAIAAALGIPEDDLFEDTP